MMLCLIYGQTILKALKGDYHKCGIYYWRLFCLNLSFVLSFCVLYVIEVNVEMFNQGSSSKRVVKEMGCCLD